MRREDDDNRSRLGILRVIVLVRFPFPLTPFPFPYALSFQPSTFEPRAPQTIYDVAGLLHQVPEKL